MRKQLLNGTWNTKLCLSPHSCTHSRGFPALPCQEGREERQECNFASSVKAEQLWVELGWGSKKSWPQWILAPTSLSSLLIWAEKLGERQDCPIPENKTRNTSGGLSHSTEWQRELLPFQNNHTGHVYNTDCYKQHPLPFSKITLHRGMMEKMVSKIVLGKQLTENIYKAKHA